MTRDGGSVAKTRAKSRPGAAESDIGETPSSGRRNKLPPAPAERHASAVASKAIAKPKNRAMGEDQRITVVGVGASAGGLDAFKRFFAAMPSESGLALVLVQHLDPTHESMVAELLSKHTQMRVVQAEDRMPIEANHVYVMPPNRNIAVRAGELHLTLPRERRGMRMPIDFFFRSLAEDRKQRAIGIILSGTGSDGTAGLRSIKEHGGVAMVQDPESAQFDGMPTNAVAAGIADYILPIDSLPGALVKFVGHSYLKHAMLEETPHQSQDHLNMILSLLRARNGHDFRGYKKTTLSRRVQRRMGLNHVEDCSEYLRMLRVNPDEVSLLYKDLLIGVTRFFREPNAWNVLERRVIPEVVKSVVEKRPVRFWVAGCASGEEAYTVAMLLNEHMSKNERMTAQVFASDIDEKALNIARRGWYPENVVADVRRERAHRFFVRTGGGYRVTPALRKSVTFALQNLIADPPFSMLDVIVCRNLLIYLEKEVQQRVLKLFHFALNDQGFLFLGNSETVGSCEELFEPVSKKWRIYRKKPLTARKALPPAPVYRRAVLRESAADPIERDPPDVHREAHQVLLGEYVPPSVVMAANGEILYFINQTGDFLENPTGKPTRRLMEMVRDDLRTKLRAAVHRASRTGERVSVPGANIEYGGESFPVTVTVRPLGPDDRPEKLLLVSFERARESNSKTNDSASGVSVTDEQALQQLELEVKNARMELQCTIDELETSNEELKASHEEVMSINLELQSTNEELETSKEELQSLNEELNTVNNQLQEKIAELEGANNDLTNLLSSADIATIFLDTDLCITRYTRATTDLINVIPADAGRPISDLSSELVNLGLPLEARAVLKSSSPVERHLSVGSRSYVRRILPYRTSDDRIDGVVITFHDVTELLSAKRIQETHERLRLALEGAQMGTWEWNPDDGTIRCDFRERELLGLSQEDDTSANVFFGRIHQDDAALVKRVMEASLVSGDDFEREFRLATVNGDTRWLTHRGRALKGTEGEGCKLLGVTFDVTARKENEEATLALAVLCESSNDAIIAISPDGVVSRWNGAAERLYGYRADDVMGKPSSILVPEDRSGEMLDVVRRIAKGEDVPRFESVRIRSDGRPIQVSVTTSPVRDARGELVAVLSISPPSNKTATILMAEDEPADRDLAEEAFKEARLANPLYFVSDGRELLAYLRREGAYRDASKAPYPSLIILDLNMPRLDGREALKEIKQDPVLRRIPVVVMTTSQAEKDIVRSYELGVNAFIAKPVQFDDMVKIVKKLEEFWFEIVELPAVV